MFSWFKKLHTVFQAAIIANTVLIFTSAVLHVHNTIGYIMLLALLFIVSFIIAREID